MRRMKRAAMAAGFAVLALGLTAAKRAGGPAQVDQARIEAAENNAEWLSYGRTYSEQRFSPLDQINAPTAGKLGLAWTAEFETDRGQEATPIVVDGVLYTTTAWSHVHAFDAKTGERLWSYDPKVDGARGFSACCDVVNRGAAAWKGRIYVGALDGRLIALDAATGKEAWSVQTTDLGQAYTITGAPRVVKGLVIIGNGGAEYGVRGYVSAYDAATGKLAWRFYTTPNPDGKPDHAASDAIMAKTAAATWFGSGWKESGGGGTAWDAIAYDPRLDLLYLGIGNGSPWNHQKRSDGKGDNLFLSSILAVRPQTGEYVWHYQTTPGESWDYTATQHIMLADLKIGGKPRRVVMQAPKNGFFYVLDAATGKLISAEKYVPVNWADHIDPKTGRPVEDPRSRYLKAASHQASGPLGGHNWQPMAFNPKTGLVYIPAMLMPGSYSNPTDYKFVRGAWNVGQGGFGATPAGAADKPFAPPTGVEFGGRLVAWDPVAQKARWSVKQAGPWNSGLLATAGGLVFGGAGKDFKAWSAATGAEAWSYAAGAGIVAAPMTYALDGKQYLAVMVGFGGAGGMGAEPRRKGRLLVFALDGTGKLAPYPAVASQPPLDLANAVASTGDPKQGMALYGQFCGACHGGGGFLPNLRATPTILEPSVWKAVVYDGGLSQNGMAGFARFMNEAQVESIRAYLLDQARAMAKR